jgi:two-component system C4-dicarboxylate transport sensor histidine kinase DctB
VTHDLNNYLGAIMAYAELVALEGPDSKESIHMLQEIVQGVLKCSSLVNDLTGIARREKPDASLVSMSALVERVLNLRRYDFKINHVELQVDVVESSGELILDRPKIEMVVIYLLSNALEASLDEPKRRKTRITVTDLDDAVEMTVWNSGDPIAPEICDAMFEPFFTTKGAEHLGLGLTACRQIANLHSGSLTYDPERGFVLCLPRENQLDVD